MHDFARELPEPSVTVMDFSGVYEKESFCRQSGIHWLDCRDISGIYGYCDHAGADALRNKIRNLSPEGIHFIDSGNYHYVTGFWIEKIREPFNLVVFDHHTDMKKALFGDILSCGDWIMKALELIPNLRKVLLIGITKEQACFLASNPFVSRICCYDAEMVHRHHFAEDLQKVHENLPVYCSIDKDVLDPSVVETDWDQGSLSVWEFAALLKKLLQTHRILGIDVCGECADTIQSIPWIARDDRFNLALLNFLESQKNKTEHPVLLDDGTLRK